VTTNYMLKNISKPFWYRVKMTALQEEKTVKQLILELLEAKVREGETIGGKTQDTS
jgi:hypothetical protein